MRFSSTVLVGSIIAAAAATSLSSGQLKSINALEKIMGRQIRFCKPIPVGVNSCSLSCGDGYVTCVSWPTCYNPGAGDSCCSNGQYCKIGTYCTDGGCCPNGSSLAECGATVSLSIILPVTVPATTSTAPTTSAVVTTTTTTSSAVVTTTSSSSSTTSSTTSTSSSSTSSSSPTTTTLPSTTRAPSGGSSSTSSTAAIFTGAAQSVGVGAAQVVVGGLAMFMML